MTTSPDGTEGLEPTTQPSVPAGIHSPQRSHEADIQRVPRRVSMWLLLLAAITPLVVALPWQLQYGPPAGADDYGQYLSHARALVEGRGYADIGYIRTRYALAIGPAVEPPGLPWTLAPIIAVFGPSRIAVRILMTLTAVAAAWLAARYVAERSGVVVGAAVAVQTAVALQLQRATLGIGADLGFTALLWAVMLVVDRDGKWSARRTVGTIILGSAATFYRTAAAPLGLAMILHGALRPRGQRRAPLIVGFVLLGVFAAMSVMLSRMPLQGDAQIAPGLAPSVLASDFGQSPSAVFDLLKGRAQFLLLGLASAFTYPFDAKPVNNVYHGIALLIALLGLVMWLHREWRSITAIFAVGYSLMLCVVPVQDARYLWPLYPLAGYGLILGVGHVLSAARRDTSLASGSDRAQAPSAGSRFHARAAIAVSAVMLFALALRAAERTPPALEDRADVQELFTRLKSSARHDSLRVAFFSPRALTWNTHIPAMGTFAASPAEVLAELESKRVSHVITGDLGTQPKRDAAMREAIRAYPLRFSLAFSNASFSVYRFRGP